jgi:hypothetical protein
LISTIIPESSGCLFGAGRAAFIATAPPRSNVRN